MVLSQVSMFGKEKFRSKVNNTAGCYGFVMFCFTPNYKMI